MQIRVSGKLLSQTVVLCCALLAFSARSAAAMPVVYNALPEGPAERSWIAATALPTSVVSTKRHTCGSGRLASITRTVSRLDADPLVCAALEISMAGALYWASQINEAIRLNNLALDACRLTSANCNDYEVIGAALQNELEQAEALFFACLLAAVEAGCFDFFRGGV